MQKARNRIPYSNVGCKDKNFFFAYHKRLQNQYLFISKRKKNQEVTFHHTTMDSNLWVSSINNTCLCGPHTHTDGTHRESMPEFFHSIYKINKN